MDTKPAKAAAKIRQQIQEEVYQINERLPSERKLAEQFNCTQFTISKALSILEDEGLVEKKRGSGNYVKNTRTMKTVVYLTSQQNNLINLVWNSIYDALSLMPSPDIHYVLCVVPEESDEFPFFKLAEADIIISAKTLSEVYIDKILQLEKPVIWLEEYHRPLPGSTIVFNNYRAGEIAANHLYDQGCRNLVYVQYEHGNALYSDQRRFEGFKNMLQQKKEHINLLTYTWFGEESAAMQRLQLLLRKDNHIDGVFCFADSLVPGVIKAAHMVNRKVPDDLLVIGVDGSALSEIFIPTFSSLGQPDMEFAAKIVAEITKIKNNDASQKIQFVEPVLVVRESTNCKITAAEKSNVSEPVYT